MFKKDPENAIQHAEECLNYEYFERKDNFTDTIAEELDEEKAVVINGGGGEEKPKKKKNVKAK